MLFSALAASGLEVCWILCGVVYKTQQLEYRNTSLLLGLSMPSWQSRVKTPSWQHFTALKRLQTDDSMLFLNGLSGKSVRQITQLC